MGRTKYNLDWEKTYPWLKRVDNDVHSAYCMVCFNSFKIDNQGIGQVKSHARCHETNPKKKAALEQFLSRPQRTFSVDNNKSVGLADNISITWSNSDKVLKAEIIDALHLVEYNQSFSSVNGNASRYERMFENNPIVAGYSMGETKVAYIIKFGIADYLKKKLRLDVDNVPFSFLFDESTTSQIKKQYDAYVIYWSDKLGRVSHAYCGSIFVGHCTSDDLVNHYEQFVTQLGLDSGYLLHFGMDVYSLC